MTTSLSFKKSLVLIFSALILLLAGCAELNSNFSCPMQPGVQCNSLDQVNTMIDQGKIGTKKTAENSNRTMAFAQNQSIPLVNFANGSNSEFLRYPETVMRIWVAPYQDQDGNYYQPGTLYSVVKPGQWANVPASIIH